MKAPAPSSHFSRKPGYGRSIGGWPGRNGASLTSRKADSTAGPTSEGFTSPNTATTMFGFTTNFR